MSNNSWQHLPQEPRWSKQRLRSVFLKLLCMGFVVALIVGIGLFFTPRVPVQPLEQLKFSTNGVLDKAWLVNHVTLPWKQSLLSIDLEKLQQQILKFTQIESVNLCRDFPNTLEITLKEREAFAKLLLKNGKQSRLGLVDKNGNIFSPIKYQREVLKIYPILTGVSKKIVANNQIIGFSDIVYLLNVLKEKSPDLYAAISRVSLKHFDPFLEKKWRIVDVEIGKSWVITFPLQTPEVALNNVSVILKSLSVQQRKMLKKMNVSLTHPTVEFR